MDFDWAITRFRIKNTCPSSVYWPVKIPKSITNPTGAGTCVCRPHSNSLMLFERLASELMSQSRHPYCKRSSTRSERRCLDLDYRFAWPLSPPIYGLFTATIKSTIKPITVITAVVRRAILASLSWTDSCLASVPRGLSNFDYGIGFRFSQLWPTLPTAKHYRLDSPFRSASSRTVIMMPNSTVLGVWFIDSLSRCLFILTYHITGWAYSALDLAVRHAWT